MPPRTAPKNASAAAAVGGRDHISNLPDDALHHMLSFLPALDVVRTCVLAKRWRHLWKSTTVLRFVCGGFKEPKSIKKIQDFVDQLLRLRIGERTPLDTCEFRVGEDDEFDMIRFILWIRIALQCKVRVLQVINNGSYPGIQPLDDHPFFISQYLTRLELKQVYETKPNRFLDLSCCPNLEDLEIVDCCLEGALLLSSQSLKCLFIEDSSFGDGDDGYRMPICAPNLVSLWLDVYCGRTPLLQRMPSLLTAFVKIRDSDDHVTLAFDDDSNQSILLQALSEVSNLSLLSLDDEMFVFRRDLKFCSGFNNLKSLLLNEYWCEPADFSALACLLKLCPVLEKFTLELYSTGPKYKMEIKLNCNPLEISPEISPHLKIVEVKCQEYDERINNVLTFLTKQIYFS